MATIDLFEYDKSLGFKTVAGVDEVGRGPLAGPVVTACCALDNSEMIDGINDSKKLSEKKRERLYERIIKASTYSVAMVSPREIDEINILRATEKAMRECVIGLKIVPDLVLIDAVKLDLPYVTRSIIKGDATSYSIAAASIIAKVTRDKIMIEADSLYPQYGFARNKGYGTKEHIAALKKFGPCPIHRRSFIKNFVEANNDVR